MLCREDATRIRVEAGASVDLGELVAPETPGFVPVDVRVTDAPAEQ